MEQERRYEVRHPAQGVAVLQTDQGEFSCEIVNLSLNGAQLAKPSAWAGAAGSCRVWLSQWHADRSFALTADVVWQTQQGIGLQFEPVQGRDRVSFNRLLSNLAAEAITLEAGVI